MMTMNLLENRPSRLTTSQRRRSRRVRVKEDDPTDCLLTFNPSVATTSGRALQPTFNHNGWLALRPRSDFSLHTHHLELVNVSLKKRPPTLEGSVRSNVASSIIVTDPRKTLPIDSEDG